MFQCIGQLITQSHIIAPASCMHFVNVLPDSYYLATGVFIDYRPTKSDYSMDTSIIPLSWTLFSNNITVHPHFNRHQSENNLAIITVSLYALWDPCLISLLLKYFSYPFHFPKQIVGILNPCKFQTGKLTSLVLKFITTNKKIVSCLLFQCDNHLLF